MTRRLRVLLIAEEAAGAEALRMLAGSPHEIVAVVTSFPREPATGASVAGIANRLGYRLFPAKQVRERAFEDLIRREGVQLLLNVHGLYVLPAEVVAAPSIGSFNLHPGPLPRYAGLNAPCWAIYHGEPNHGVTVHWMDEGINTGPLAFASGFPIDQDDTGLTLSSKCIRAGLPLLHDLLSAAGEQRIPRQPQPAGPRRYYGREVPQEGRLFWTESAVRVVNFIRACDYSPFPSPWRSPRAYLGGREVSVLKAGLTGERSDAPPGTVGPRVGDEVLVAARDHWVRVERIQVGSSTFAAAEALRPGERFAIPAPAERIPVPHR
jgi:methionyl-tRNA formyltransferase